jgi:sRNA-binding protein
MAEIDLNAAIQVIIAAAVDSDLAPYRELLDRMAKLTGADMRVPSRAPPARVEAPVHRRRGRNANTNTANVGAFTVGQKVSYKQGRGAFEALVAKIDIETDTLMLQRCIDRKMVERPMSKIYT